jgi:GNAT superfamily N-acetyltransferase
VTRRCGDEDWRDVRRLHIKLALGYPVVVDVDLNEVLATPDAHWQHFVAECARGREQALFVAVAGARCAGMGHVSVHQSLARLSMLYVDGKERRHGLGAALVAAQEEWARAEGATELVCHIPDVSAAGRLARELGWQRSEEVFFTKNGLRERKWTTGCGRPRTPEPASHPPEDPSGSPG